MLTANSVSEYWVNQKNEIQRASSLLRIKPQVDFHGFYKRKCKCNDRNLKKMAIKKCKENRHFQNGDLQN